MKNSKLDISKQNQLIELFIAGNSARAASKVVGVNKVTANYYFHRLRKIIQANNSGKVENEVKEVANFLNNCDPDIVISTPIFGVINDEQKIHTVLFSELQIDTWIQILFYGHKIDAIFYNTSRHGFNVFDVSKFNFICTNHMKVQENSISGNNVVQDFCRYTKAHLLQFNGIPIKNFKLYLKECEWRYNNKGLDLKMMQLSQWIV